ncbi:VOC family protein [Streptomyces litchfieldiae]|uniref:VOC family protein n=1 Tax=Streptomyces litchfieldiae TaxID=3075543 RepID=A0ABU2MZE9_9ACTN|nr:VOC family protein [Streptomyces sp. DSM 44938]MDT0347036.1 VOC family protein [Streptomyces sp. DSM 44938]
MSTQPGMSYIEIGVTDAERSLDFYRGTLGLGPAAAAPEPPTPGVHWLSADGALVKLVEMGADSTLGGWLGDDLQRGMRHVGLKVGDVFRQAERLRSAGVEFTIEPTAAVGDVNLAFFRDPDGTLLEIIDGHLRYHSVVTPELADRERRLAEARPAGAGPVFDHVAVTAGDLDATLEFYRDRLGYPVIGRLVHDRDPRGFVIDYLQAGPAVLEVFSFTAPTTPAPAAPDGGTSRLRGRLGLRAIGLAGTDLAGELAAGPDGVPLRPLPAV